MIRRSRQKGQKPCALYSLRQMALVLSANACASPGDYLTTIRYKTLQHLRVLIVYYNLIGTKIAYLRLDNELPPSLPFYRNRISLHQLTSILL